MKYKIDLGEDDKVSMSLNPSLSKQYWHNYCMPGPVLFAWDSSVCKLRSQVPFLHEAHSLLRVLTKKHTVKINRDIVRSQEP